MTRTLDIIARKPSRYRASEGAEYAVIDIAAYNPFHPFVSCTITPHLVAHGQWSTGYYFATKDEALAHFNAR